MTKYEMKKKIFALIEELSPSNPYLTDDTDLQAKVDYSINQVMFELARYKKIPKYVEIPVKKGDILTLEDIGNKVGYSIYQIKKISEVAHDIKADGTVFKFKEDGVAEIEVYVYPERILESTKDKAYEFELSDDVLEVMPYGVAADLLKSDESVDNGKIYADTYREKLQGLDLRYVTTSVTFEGGWDG